MNMVDMAISRNLLLTRMDNALHKSQEDSKHFFALHRDLAGQTAQESSIAGQACISMFLDSF